MDYASFDLLAAAAPAALLLRGAAGRRALVGPVLLLAAVALAWTAPWDEHLVSSGVWSYPDDRVLGRFGSVPVEEYVLVALEVLLVGAWGLYCRALRPGVGVRTGVPVGVRPTAGGPARSRRSGRGRLGPALLTAAGLGLVLVGGHLRYLGLVLVWAGPPLLLQRCVAGDLLRELGPARLRMAVPPLLWLCLVDRLALADGIWSIAPGSSTGLDLLGLPVEEAAFFAVTCLLVTDGLLLAVHPEARRRLVAAVATVRAGSLLTARQPAHPRRTVGG